MKDHRTIDMTKIDTFFVDPHLNVTLSTKFTKETAAHFCCKNGHSEILRKILIRNPDASKLVDDLGNSILHSLLLVSKLLYSNLKNSVSKYVELNAIIHILKEAKAFDP